jgi:hypothetical protein
VASLVETTFDFGEINEEDGYAEHVFLLRNTGSAPLTITQVQTSCGCTEPDWTRDPIAPGGEGQIFITYSTKNRPGPFKKNISVYTTDKERRLRLTITGEVIPKSKDLQRVFRDTIGSVQMEQTAFTFSAVQPKETAKQEIWIQNFAEGDVTLSIENASEYLTVEAPGVLKSGKPERLKLSLDAGKLAGRKGRLLTQLTWKTVDASGAVQTQNLPVAINSVDDFSALTAEEKKNSPTAQFSTGSLSFGTLKTKGGFPGRSKRVSQSFTVKNTGKKPLILHSITCDDVRVRIAEPGKKTLQPEDSVTLNITLQPKTIEGALAEDIYIICNDPQGPVREVRVTAER